MEGRNRESGRKGRILAIYYIYRISAIYTWMASRINVTEHVLIFSLFYYYFRDFLFDNYIFPYLIWLYLSCSLYHFSLLFLWFSIWFCKWNLPENIWFSKVVLVCNLGHQRYNNLHVLFPLFLMYSCAFIYAYICTTYTHIYIFACV